MSSPKKEEIINNLPVFLSEYLKAELYGENRKALTNIQCEENREIRMTECSVYTEPQPDDEGTDMDTDLITAEGGYSVPEGVEIPINVYWEFDDSVKETKITAQAYWDEIIIREGSINE